MTSAVRANRLPLTALLMAGSLVASFLLFWRSASPLSAWVGVDLDFLFLPLALWATLMLLSRLAAWAAERRVSTPRWWPARSGDGLQAVTVLTFARRFLAELAWFGLAVACIGAIPAAVEAVYGHPYGPGLSGALQYLKIVGQLLLWGLPLLILVAGARALAKIRPGVGALLPSPWAHLTVIGGGYVLLAPGGMLEAVFPAVDFMHWLTPASAIGMAYAASVMRRVLTLPLKPSTLRSLRMALLIFEAAWAAIALTALSGLPSAVESVLVGHLAVDPAMGATYVESLRELTSPQALAVVLPFAMARAAGVYWPRVDAALGFPSGRLALLGAVYVLFSTDGVVSLGLQISTAQIMPVLMMGLALSYAASIARNVRALGWGGRFEPGMRAGIGLAGAGILALVVGMIVDVILEHLPVVNAVLLDYESSREVGRSVLPYFSALLDGGYSLTAFGAALAFAWSLPRGREDAWCLPWQPVLNAVCYAVAGCLAWLVGAALSPLGHGMLLAGATVGAGMFALALVQILDYAVGMRNATLAPVVTWLMASPARGFVLGGAAAIYLMLLRPALYEVLWFAALYEYIALMAFLAMALLFVLGLLRRNVDAAETTDALWADWSHHRQTLESKEDPRAALTARMRRRFIDVGEWKPLWAYFMALLYRSGVSQEWMCHVCRPLRASVVTASRFPFLRRSAHRRMARAAALAEALRRTDSALMGDREPAPAVTDEDLRQAAAQFINTGAEVERLAIALIVAHCQRGRDLESAMDRWFGLLDTPDSGPFRFSLPRGPQAVRLRNRHERLQFVDGAAAMLFGSASPAPGPAAPETLAEPVGVSVRTRGPGTPGE